MAEAYHNKSGNLLTQHLDINMAEDKIDEEVFMDDSSIAIEDTENGSEDASKSGNIIPFIMERYKKADDNIEVIERGTMYNIREML